MRFHYFFVTIFTTNKTKESNRYYNVFTVISILLLISFCFLIPLVIRIAVPYKASYYESFQFVGIIAAGYATRSIINFYLSTILYSKNTSLLIKIFGLSSFVQIIATYFLVKEFGLIGAIYAGIITKLSQVFFAYLLTKSIFTYNFNYFKIIGLPVLYIIFNVVMFQIFPAYNYILYIIQLVVFSIILYFMFKNEISAVYKQFFGKKVSA